MRVGPTYTRREGLPIWEGNPSLDAAIILNFYSMKKYFLAVASFFIYSHISLGQVYPGQMDSTFVPVRSHHYDPELTFDFCVNGPRLEQSGGYPTPPFGSTDRLYFPEGSTRKP